MTEKIDVPLYKGEVIITYYPNSHQYKLNGERLVSVSKALDSLAKPALIPWAVNMAVDYLRKSNLTPEDFDKARFLHQEKANEAANIGHLVHTWCEGFIKSGGKDLPEDDNVLNGVLAFLRWVEYHKVRFIQSERLVYSRNFGYVGTLDAIAEIDGKVCLVDFKSSNSFRLTHALQCAAYRNAVEEEDGHLFTGPNTVIRFDKNDASFYTAQFPDYADDLQAFLGLLAVTKREKQAIKDRYVPTATGIYE